MKIILAGPTGHIGSQILTHLLSLPSVSRVVALSRRELPASSPASRHPKLDVVVIPDFGSSASYADPAVRARLAGAEACVWALGGPRDGEDVHVGFTRAAMEGLRGVWEGEDGKDGEGGEEVVAARREKKKKFRFVYTSGAAVVRDQGAFVLLVGGVRKMRGRVETEVLEFEKSHAGAWESHLMRPAMVVNEESPVGFKLGLKWLGLTIWNPRLAAAAGVLATEGREERIWGNAELGELGRGALGEAKQGK